MLFGSHLGNFSIVNVSKINNIDDIVDEAYKGNFILEEIGDGKASPVQIIAYLISQKNSIEEGIAYAQERIYGSCTLILMNDKGIYAARDKLGRTPLIIGNKDNDFAISSESCAFHNLGYKIFKELGPGEIVFINKDGIKQKKKPNDEMKICSFLWIYYGNPASCYEGIEVEPVRYRCGEMLAKRDSVEVDAVAGIPDSGTAHAIGYANESKKKYSRPYTKYIETWRRSFMPQDQSQRDLVAKMKLNPSHSLIKGKRLLFCDDSIVRGTQLKDQIKRIYELGAKEVHMRIACPPLIYGCKFLNFSRSRSESDLAARRAIEKLEGTREVSKDVLAEYSNPDSEKYKKMVEVIREELGMTTLQYQRLDDMVQAIGLPKCKLCTYCWDGCG